MAQVDVTISNAEPRRDIHGDIIDCHDGNIMEWPEGVRPIAQS
jgi:hypothetical protein